MSAEGDAKRERLLARLHAAGLEGVLLSLPGNIAWYTGGARTQVIQSVESGVADLLVARDGDVLFTDAIEAERLEREELGGLVAELRVRPWASDRSAALPRDPRLGTDASHPGLTDASVAVRRARESLTVPEIDRYRVLATETAEVLTHAAFAVSPRQREHEVAAVVAAGLLERGIDVPVLLVAGAARLPVYRHPLPTDATLGDRVMIVVCARRAGLFACATRLVAFTPLTSAEQSRYERLLRVESAFFAATKEGRRLGDVFTEGIAAYAATGLGPDEWQRHHQGGPTGYFGRDEIVTHASDARVAPQQAFAWNPSAPGLKVEDTVVVGDDGLDVLTRDPDWPTADVDGLARPTILERS